MVYPIWLLLHAVIVENVHYLEVERWKFWKSGKIVTVGPLKCYWWAVCDLPNETSIHNSPTTLSIHQEKNRTKTNNETSQEHYIVQNSRVTFGVRVIGIIMGKYVILLCVDLYTLPYNSIVYLLCYALQYCDWEEVLYSGLACCWARCSALLLPLLLLLLPLLPLLSLLLFRIVVLRESTHFALIALPNVPLVFHCPMSHSPVLQLQ